jgi:1-acyl-sn-glycerol-3-phosphate acyltransferase
MLLFAPFLLLAGLTFDRDRRLTRRAVRALFPRLLRGFAALSGTPLQLDPLPAIPGPCIIVANHASCIDVLLLMALPAPLGNGRVWAKDWPFHVPLLGALMRLSGHLFVNDFNLLPDAQDCLADGSSLLVFPESSRSRTGRLSRFHDGAFLLAARTNRPILPVAIHGSFACMPPGQPWVFRPHLRVQPLPLLYPDPADPKAHIAVRREAHALIQKALHPSAQAAPEPVPEPAAA